MLCQYRGSQLESEAQSISGDLKIQCVAQAAFCVLKCQAFMQNMMYHVLWIMEFMTDSLHGFFMAKPKFCGHLQSIFI
jgi:hypothetical protein